jgi:hypothetical protein
LLQRRQDGTMKEVLQTTEVVTRESLRVHIDTEAIERFTRGLLAQGTRSPSWDCRYHLCETTEKMVAYLLVLDTLNFCFWALPGQSRWEIEYGTETVSGYFGLAAALKQTLTCGVPITDPGYLATMTEDLLRNILGGRGVLPLCQERVRNLNELGQVLLEVYDGNPVRLVETAGKSAAALARLVAEKLPSFRDVARYHGREVFFYKRAQIFASDLHSAFHGQGWGEFRDVNTLTAFADYKLPQVLRHVGVLTYDQALSDKVDNRIPLDAGSAEEVEIRANTVWAVELIRRNLEQHGKQIHACEIDGMLWTLGQRDKYRVKPYHRTLTVFY